MKKFHLFSLGEPGESYTYPLVKIVFCIVIILLLIFRNHFIHVDQLILEIIIGVVCVVLGIACILCIEIAFAQLLVVRDNRSEICKQMNGNTKECVDFSADKAVSLISQNDIIDFEIVSNGMCYHVGASSDNKRGDSVFFNKLYYVGNQEFDNLDDFKEELLKHSANGQIQVVSIDGVTPECYC